MSYSDGDFLMWIRNRLVNVYGESPNTDFVLRLQQISEKQSGEHRFGPEDVDEQDRGLLR